MVCPLRFVLVGLSAIVAAVGMYYTFWCEDAPVAKEGKKDKKEPQLSWWQRIWSLFNGRYLYDEWEKRKARLAAAEKARKKEEPWCPPADIAPANPQGEEAPGKTTKIA